MKWFRKRKDRLVVLLGAGSTIHAGAPSTVQITEHVKSVANDSVKAIIEAVTAQRGPDSFNFETILYALEELDIYLLRRQFPQGWDLLGGVLTAFTQLRTSCAAVEHNPLLIDRMLLLAWIAKFVWEKTKDASARDLSDFLNRLGNDFQLTIFTLNYDDIIDRTATCFDGFTDVQETPTPHFRLNPSQFRARFHSDKRALAHLHGSVRFGRNSKGTEVVKYRNVDDAIKALEAPHLNASAPLISGFNKETKLVREPTPFGYYYQAFIEAMLNTPRLLLAGYGGLDPHVTTWFSEFTRLNGDARRVVWIDIKRPAFPASVNFLPIEASFPPTDKATRDQIVNHLRLA